VTSAPFSLADLAVGESARIVDLAGEDSLVQRLLEMGLTEGEDVAIVRLAPLGDPIELTIRGYHLSLRKKEAAMVFVERL